jgi:Zn-dependent metalloprotease
MKRSISSPVARMVLCGVVAACAASCTPSIDMMRQDAQGRLQLTQNPLSGTPSFVRTQVPLSVMGLVPGADGELGPALVARYADLFGLDDPGHLEVLGEITGPLGMRHVTMKQVHRGVDVYGGEVTVHVSRDGERVMAVTNSAVPDLRMSNTSPRIDVDAALRAARRFMPEAELVSSSLAIYPGIERPSSAQLAWLVELRDDAIPARRVYVVCARDGQVIDVLDRLYIARNRRTYTANHKFDLPGTLRRSEGDPAVGDSELDRVHDFAGDTYDYYSQTHNRDSYDNLGATLLSTAHYRTDFQNAFWDGVQMVYGDGFAVRDVAAHEMTHAVTEHAAGLEYRWQSGALNESFSDIFGAMVDRGDWLVGEDLPHGPIRNMENPEQFNHPGHTDDFRAMCGDNEGVHINSGIHNKAFVNVAEAIGKDRAELIFYRALTVYLGTKSSFEDARSAALQSAADLFGEGGRDFQAVEQGFAGVGIDGSFDPGPSGCDRSDSSDHSHRGESLKELLLGVALLLGGIGLYNLVRRPLGS